MTPGKNNQIFLYLRNKRNALLYKCGSREPTSTHIHIVVNNLSNDTNQHSKKW